MRRIHSLPLFRWLGSGGAKAPGDLLAVRFLLAGGEVVNIALHAVELAGGFHRVNGVIVSCPSLYVFQSHAEHRIGMVLIQPGLDTHALGLPLRDVASNMRDVFDFRQGYLNFHYVSAQLFVGRQELKFGDERVVGISDWTNNSRTWDGADLRIGAKDRIDLFATSVVTIYPTSLDKHGAGLTFHGVEGNIQSLLPKTSIQPFVLIRALPRVISQQDIPGTETEVTFGSYYDTTLPHGFSSSGTGGLQRASYSNDSIHAGAAIIRGGYVAANRPWKPHIEGEYDYATGNPHINPFRIGTYDQQYPSNHNAFGLVDLFGFQNIKQDRLNLSLAPKENFLLLFQAESLHVASIRDGVYTVAGSSLFNAPAGGFLHDGIGSGFDALAKYIYHQSRVINIGVGHFFPGYRFRVDH
jgi:Alginate export